MALRAYLLFFEITMAACWTKQNKAVGCRARWNGRSRRALWAMLRGPEITVSACAVVSTMQMTRRASAATSCGEATIFAWNSNNVVNPGGQLALIVNGFQIGLAPEPASLGFLALGGLLLGRRRRN